MRKWCYLVQKKNDIPQSMVGKPAKLISGRIVDADSAFINGVFVGTVSYQYPPRRYDIPEGFMNYPDASGRGI